MELDLIENNGPDNLRDTLRAYLPRATDVSVAVAFVTQSGLDEILQPLREAAVSGRVRLLTGLYQKVTEPAALRTLLRVQEETRGRFSVRLSTEPQFHRKLYVLRKPRLSIAIIGSSNLTREGLRSGGELNLLIRLPLGSPAAKQIAQAFEDDWNRRAVRLVVGQIITYEKTRPTAPNGNILRKGELAKILGQSPAHREAAQGDQPRGNWRDCINGVVKKRTEQILSETTNWDDKGYGWYSPGGPHPYKIGDRIFLFDLADKQVRLVEVKDMTRTKVATPDGRYFVAYRPLPRQCRHFSKRLWATLAEEGINRRNTRVRRKLSPGMADRLKLIIRQKRKPGQRQKV